MTARELIPLPEPAAGATRPRLMPIEGDGMEPTLRHGDYVAVVPIDRFRCDGLYVLERFGVTDVYRCQTDFAGKIIVWHDNRRYGGKRYPLTVAQFNEGVVGYVVATVNVLDRTAFG